MTADALRPMLASAGALPTGSGWAFEFKWDGVRAVVTVDSTDAQPIRAMSRNDRDFSASYPELDRLVEQPTVAGSSWMARSSRWLRRADPTSDSFSSGCMCSARAQPARLACPAGSRTNRRHSAASPACAGMGTCKDKGWARSISSSTSVIRCSPRPPVT